MTEEPEMSKRALYDTDFYAWASEQAILLRAGRITETDLDQIAEEIECMGRREKHELESRLVVLLLHSRKWRFQPLRRSPSGQATIRIQRLEIRDLFLADPRAVSVPVESETSSTFLFCRIFATRTGIHFAGKCSSLEPIVPDLIARAYEVARIAAGIDTGLAESTFPAARPWSYDEIMDDGFWPDDQ